MALLASLIPVVPSMSDAGVKAGASWATGATARSARKS
jgi:hypothetical protein